MKRVAAMLGLVAISGPLLVTPVPGHTVFQEYATLPAGVVAWADFDLDGDLDLFTGCVGWPPSGETPQAHILRNDAGTFVETQTLPCGTSILGNSQPWADYDQDGDPDLALPGRFASYMYRNDGGVFVPDTRTSLPVQSSGGVWFQWGDVDGANGPDLVIVGVDYSGVYANDGTGVLHLTQDLLTQDVHNGDLGDFDSDGDPDLVVIGGWGPYFGVYRNDAGAFSEQLTLPGVAGYDVHWVDYNSDGLLDIFVAGVASPTQSRVELWRQGPPGSFSLDTAQPGLDAFAALGFEAQLPMAAWGDYDHDGDPDLFLSGGGTWGCLTMTFLNTTGGTLIEDPDSGLNDAPICYSYPRWGDFDRDGDLDLAAWEQGGSVKVFMNGGAPAPVTQPSLEPPAVRVALSPSIPALQQPFQFNLTLEDAAGMPLSNYSLDLTLLTPSGETVEGLSGVTTAQGTWQIPETYRLAEPGPYVYNLSIEGLGSFNYTAVVPGPAVSVNYEDLILSAAERGGLPTDEIQVYALPFIEPGNSGRTYAGETTYVPDAATGTLLPIFDVSLSEEDQLRLYAYQYLNPGDYTYVPPDPERLARAMALLEEDARRDMAEFAGMLDDGLTLVIFAKEAFVCTVGVIGTGATAGAAAPLAYVACAPLVIHLTTYAANEWIDRECRPGGPMDSDTCSDLRGGLTIASSSILYIIAPEETGARETLHALGFATSFLEGSSEILYGSEADGTVMAHYMGASFEIVDLAADASDLSSSLMFTARSPIQFEVVDPEGRRLGYDPETDWIVSEIPGASITLPGMVPQRAWIPNPLDGDYEVDVTGTGTGDYAIEIARANRGESPVVETFTGSVTTGEQLIHEVQVELDDEGRILVSGTPPAEQPRVTGWRGLVEGRLSSWILAGGSLLCCASAVVLAGVGIFFAGRRRRKT